MHFTNLFPHELVSEWRSKVKARKTWLLYKFILRIITNMMMFKVYCNERHDRE